MSKYQRLPELSGAEGGGGGDGGVADDDHATNTWGEGGNSTMTTTINTSVLNGAQNIQALLFADSSISSSNSGGSGVNSNSPSRVIIRHSSSNNQSNSTNKNNNNNHSSSINSLNSRSSATNSWEYSPFDSANTNEINNQINILETTTTTASAATNETIATTMNFDAGSTETSSSSQLLDAYDADDMTTEVPLIGGAVNNNVDYHDHLDNHRFSTASGGATIFVDATCHCHLPGFNANLRSKSAQDAKFKIVLAISLCCIFMIVEFLGGCMAGSLAIMADAAHLASDCISFVIALVAIWLGGRPPDSRMSFGYKRMEVMGAIISILGIWILTATLIMVAMERLYSNDFDLNASTMMVISGIGILINIVMAFILHGSSLVGHGHNHAHAHAHSHSHSHTAAAANNALLEISDSNGSDNELKHANKCDKDENLNLRAAMIHVIGDLVQSIGVFLASILIQIYPNAKFADPLCTLIFSVIVFMTTVHLFRESVGILLDAVPSRISLDMLTMDLINIDGVKAVHHLNVWSHTSNYSVMMVHLVIDFLSDSDKVLQRATQIACGPKYDIKHCTIQTERLTS
ncbi:proton-coupled zinc antiporter SLC30A2 isoform X1 [Eurosta solidaginis]|uniref:proton-coupled zinc antiporter SLC30A2 isoform X1 n=1 Tax=Eurosta solidaginis TaxID=178769 RepID=UPI003530DCD7